MPEEVFTSAVRTLYSSEYTCPPGVGVGKAVYLSGTDTVDLANSANPLKMPVIGIVVSKHAATKCIVQLVGEYQGLSGLTPTAPYFAATDGTGTLVTPAPSGAVVSQVVGLGIDANTLNLLPLGSSAFAGGGGPGSVFASRLHDHSVNQAKAYRHWLGHLVLETSIAANTAGNFNGGGVGQKPLVGINGYEGIALASFPKIRATVALRTSPGLGLSFSAFVDLSGTGAGPIAVVSITNTLGDELGNTIVDAFGKGPLAPASISDFDIMAFTPGDFTPATRNRSRFYVVNNLPGATGTQSNWTQNPMTLDILLNGGAYPRGGTQTVAYPNAKLCLCNDVSLPYSVDGGLPKGVLLPAIVAQAGSSAENTRNVTHVTALTFDGVNLLA